MIIQAWTEGEGFTLTLDYPNRRFILSPLKEGVTIYTSANELKDLKDQIDECLKLFEIKQSLNNQKQTKGEHHE